MRHGHDPEVVGWRWPIWQLLGFVHAEMRRHGVRCYRATRFSPVDLAALTAPPDLPHDEWADV